jgi:hypothetical protein
MQTDAPYFIILLCLPDDFTRQRQSARPRQFIYLPGRKIQKLKFPV